jgi:hypothetical protein
MVSRGLATMEVYLISSFSLGLISDSIFLLIMMVKICSPYKVKFFFRLRLSIQDLCSCMLVPMVEHIPRTATEICRFC